MTRKTAFKRVMSLIVATVMTVSMAVFSPVISSAVSGKYGVLSYEITNGEITITKCNYDVSGELVIPSEIDSYPVTVIGEGAITSCRALVSVTIPDSVTSIGEYAFYICPALKDIKVSENNQYYASYDGALYTKDKAELIRCPQGKKEVEIFNGATGIKGDAFYCCSLLTNVVIPSGVAAVDSIFYSCSALESIVVDENNQNYSSFDGVLYNKDKTQLIRCPAGKQEIEFLNSITSIGDMAFIGCSSLTSIVIPDGITSIGDMAFIGCSRLTSIVIPDGVTSIGDSAFSGCSNLVSIAIPKSVMSIGYYVFGKINHVLYSGTINEFRSIIIDHINDFKNVKVHCEVDSSAISLASETKSTWYSPGRITYKCSVCGDNFSVTLPKLPFVAELNPATNFKDIKLTSWYYDAVNYALSHKLFNGTSANTFAPDVAMTRGMLVQVLYNLEGKPTLENRNIKFTDVKEKDWFADAVIWANANGVVNGMTPTTFEPNGKITREQMTTILYRYANLKSYDVSTKVALAKFPDGDAVSGYAADSLKWAVGTGMISGNKIGGVDMLDARGSATRAQVAKILMVFTKNNNVFSE